MTRALSAKTGAAFLRTQFAAKGASLSHGESLDLFAQLQGFKAWSHMQQATAKTAPKTKASKVKKEAQISLKDLLIEQYGIDGEFPHVSVDAAAGYRKAGQDYWDFVVQYVTDMAHLEDNRQLDVPHLFPVLQPVEVTLPDGSLGKWHIEQNLSTREGELNFHLQERKPGLALLCLDDVLYGKLQAQMWDETTFIVRKDNQLGLLFEVEYLSRESEEAHDDEAANYKSHAEMVKLLTTGLRPLAEKYPQVQFCVPDCYQIINDRPAVWGFYKLDSLTEAEREELGMALFQL